MLYGPSSRGGGEGALGYNGSGGEGEAALDEFERLHDATIARLGIRRRDVVAAYHAFAKRHAARLLMERDADGTAIAGVLDVICGNRAYELYNGSVREGAAASVVNYQ